MTKPSTAPAIVPVIRSMPRRNEPAPVDISDMNPLIAAHHGEFDLERERQRGRQHDRTGRDDALPRARRVLAQLAELPPIARERLLDHVDHLGEVVDDGPGELPHHRKVPPLGKITVRASAPM